MSIHKSSLVKKETAAFEKWKLLYIHDKHHKLLVEYDSWDLLLLPSHPCRAFLRLTSMRAKFVPKENQSSHHVLATPDLALLQWLNPEIVDTIFLLCLFLILSFTFSSPIPLCPKVWSSDLFCAQAFHKSPTLFFLSLCCFLYPETWKSGSHLKLDKCHFWLCSGPLNHFSFLISRAFLATGTAGPDTSGCFQQQCLGTQSLSGLQALSTTEKALKILFCDDFNLSPLAVPELRPALESLPVVIPLGRRGLFVTQSERIWALIFPSLLLSLQSLKIHMCLSWWLPCRACTACTVQLLPFVGFGFAGCHFCSCVMKNTSLALILPMVNMWPFEKVIFLFDSNFIKSKRRKCNRLSEGFDKIAIGICLYLADPENSRFLSVFFYSVLYALTK